MNMTAGLPVAAITIDQDGHTFPGGSMWIVNAAPRAAFGVF
jgi:hypothetical protein